MLGTFDGVLCEQNLADSALMRIVLNIVGRQEGMSQYSSEIAEIFKEADRRSEKYLALLKREGDLPSIVLRGHLVLEELLYRCLPGPLRLPGASRCRSAPLLAACPFSASTAQAPGSPAFSLAGAQQSQRSPQRVGAQSRSTASISTGLGVRDLRAWVGTQSDPCFTSRLHGGRGHRALLSAWAT